MFFSTVFLGFQTGRLAVFWRGFGTSSSFRAMVFSCRKVILSKLFECKQPQATESLEKCCFSTVFLGFQTGRLAVFSHGFGTSSSFRAMVFSCRKVILSKLFECKQPQATESLENLEKCCFSRISDGTFGSFSAWFWN